MARQLLKADAIHSAIQSDVGGGYADTLNDIQALINKHPIVLIGMAHNPFVKKARKRLTAEHISFEYLEYGSYTKEWHRRLAIKMWSGWPTFPMIFVNGQLIGGKQELDHLIDTKTLQALLNK